MRFVTKLGWFTLTWTVQFLSVLKRRSPETRETFENPFWSLSSGLCAVSQWFEPSQCRIPQNSPVTASVWSSSGGSLPWPKLSCISFEVFKALIVNIVAFWVVTPRSLEGRYWRCDVFCMHSDTGLAPVRAATGLTHLLADVSCHAWTMQFC